MTENYFMITRYVPMGLLCILLFLGCVTIEREDSIKPEEQINLLIERFKYEPEILLNKILDIIDTDDLSYNSLLARLELSLKRYSAAINRIKSIPGYDTDPKSLKIIVISRISLSEEYTTELDKILKIDPLNSFANNLKSKNLLKSGDINSAESCLEHLIFSGEENGESFMILGDITLNRVEELNLNGKNVLSPKEELKVTNLYKKALNYYLKSGETQKAYYYTSLSVVYRKLGKKSEAVKALGMAITLDPKNPWNYYDRGKLYFYMNSTKKALSDFKESYKLNPKHFFSNVFLGRLYFSENKINEALFHYQNVMKLNSNYTPAYKDLSVLYSIKGNKKLALDYLISLYKSKTDKDFLLPLYLVNSLLENDRSGDAKKILQNLVKYEKNSTMKGIYNYYLDPDRAGDKVINNALLFEDKYQRIRLTYYVSCALERGGVNSLSEALFKEVAESNIGFESKLAKYKLGENHE